MSVSTRCYQPQETRKCLALHMRSEGEGSTCMQQAAPQFFSSIQNNWNHNGWWELLLSEEWPDPWESRVLLLRGCSPVWGARKCSLHDQEQVPREADGMGMHFVKGDLRTCLCPQKSLDHRQIVLWKIHQTLPCPFSEAVSWWQWLLLLAGPYQ